MNILGLINNPIETIIFLVGIVMAITFHEYAHAWMAARLGDETPVLQGRTTLNPLAHLDLFGSIAFLLIGFGWGKPVVYNPMRLSRRIDELWVALAGPASNLLLAFILNVFGYLQTISGLVIVNPDFLTVVVLINIYLAAFNMIPIPPLDGSSILAYFWPPYRSLVGGQIGFILLLILIFLPGGSLNLLQTILSPVIAGFYHLTTLFGLL